MKEMRKEKQRSVPRDRTIQKHVKGAMPEFARLFLALLFLLLNPGFPRLTKSRVRA